jgi:hypothetical protein
MNTPEQDAIAAATRLLESIGTITNPNEDYPIYRVYPIVFRDAVQVCTQVLSYVPRIQELNRELSPSPCGEWGHLMVHNHLSPAGDIVCDFCSRVVSIPRFFKRKVAQ